MSQQTSPRGLHARRHQPLPGLPRARPARRRAPSATASCSPRSAAPTPTAASSTAWAAASRRSRRRVIIGAADPPGRRRRLHVRAGRGDEGGRRLHRQLRQLLVVGRALRHRRGAGARARRRDRSCASTTRTRRSSSSPTCRWRDGEAAVAGDFELAGVAGRGARIALDFVDPGGAGTGRLLPTGRARDVIAGVEASLVDATNPMVFVRAQATSASPAPRRRRRSTPTARWRRGSRSSASRRRSAMGMPGSAAVPKIAVGGAAAPRSPRSTASRYAAEHGRRAGPRASRWATATARSR